MFLLFQFVNVPNFYDAITIFPKKSGKNAGFYKAVLNKNKDHTQIVRKIQFRSSFKIYIFVQQKAWALKHDSFQNYKNTNATHNFAPRPLTFKFQ